MTKKTEEYSSNGSNGAEPVRIWKARNFIEAHSAEELSLGKVARVAHTSTNYFSEKFREATGMNFVTYVARTRFENAATLLREADLRVSEIAFAVGFQSLSQFLTGSSRSSRGNHRRNTGTGPSTAVTEVGREGFSLESQRDFTGKNA